MASEPFFPGGPPATLVGALIAGIGGLLVALRMLWTRSERRDQQLLDLHNARIEDQKKHTQEILSVTETAHQMVRPMEAAIQALKEQKKPTND